jgi:hypothetical protein
VSLYGQVGPAITLAIAPHLTRCILHGWQPAVPACACVLVGAAAAASSLEAVLCRECLECHYEDELAVSCFQCLLERGLLPSLEPPDTIDSSPMSAAPDLPALAFDIDPALDEGPTFMHQRYRARPDTD